jgi:hypothetical protein
VSSMQRLRMAWVLVIVGALMALGSGAVGFLWLNRVPDMHPVPYGEQSEFTATGSGAVTIFTSTGQSTAPTCRITTRDGRNVAVGEAERYQQAEGLDSTYGFTATPGTTYTISCGSPGQLGRFAGAMVNTFPTGVFIATGSFGLLVCAVGGVLARRQRRTEAGRPG